jgi:hypothetical protein
MFHWFDIVQNTRGDVLPGWQIECVELADGETVVPIFADENGTPIASVTGATNRAVSDENGNYFFFVPSGTYSLKFYDASGAFQRRQRFVPMYGADSAGNAMSLASNDAGLGAALVGVEGSGTVQGALNARPTSSALAAATGSTLLGFQQAGAGAVLRTVRDRLRDTINVKDFGAVGDGVTNDAPAIQAAVDFASTLSNGAGLFFPAGQYRVNSTVTVEKSGVFIEGDGHGNSWVVNGTTNGAAIQFGDGTNTYNRNGIYGMLFGQASGVTPVSGNCGLLVTKCSNFVMDNVQTFQFPDALRDGVVYDNVTQSYVSNIGLQACTNAAWVLRNNTFGIFASNGRCDTSAYGMFIRDCQGLYFTNFDNFGNSINAYNIGNSGAGDTRFFFFNNCIGDSSGEHNWAITELQVGQFTNCWGSTQSEPVTGFNGDGFYIDGPLVTDLAFNNCTAFGNNRHGINVALGFRISITGGIWGSSFNPAFAGGQGTGNGVGSTDGSGIFIGVGARRVNVTGGHATANQRYGVEVAAGAEQIEISDIETRFNVLGGVLNGANATTAECRIRNVAGFNPVGFISAPAIPASLTPITNLTGVDVTVYLQSGTLTGNVRINGAGVANLTNIPYFLPAGGTIELEYSSAPFWSWSGN